MNILDEIVLKIKQENANLWDQFDPNLITKKTREINPLKDNFLIIAEMKKASPSKGLIVSHYNPLDIANTYNRQSIEAFSILTEKNYFQGSIEDLRKIRNKYPKKILLRKDFIVHPYQIKESYDSGADIILLIVSLLSDAEIKSLYQYAKSYCLHVLVEVHDEREINRLLSLGLDDIMIGINNRDLKTLVVDIDQSFRLFDIIPRKYRVISESGLTQAKQIKELKEKGFYGVLIGHSILESKNRDLFLKELKKASQ